MKKPIFIIMLAALAFIFTSGSYGQNAGFSGTWKLDRQKSILVEYSPVLTKITINIKGDSLLTERFYDIGDGLEYPFVENVSLDGTESRITIYEMPRKAKATFSEPDNTVNLESTTTYIGSAGAEDFMSKETWKIDKENNTLTINFVNKSSDGEASGHFFFNKENL